ncbi:hypothetical protein [Campylobacter sp.]|uniref:hypothetical protein n=1 Tax=Campylobacter sp. TaxID=205 RepID=UPI0025BBBB17|nr:hypothetical protein [Campylobacter sp.]
MDSYVKTASDIAALPLNTLLVLLILCLGFILIHLYKKINIENQEKVKELTACTKETNSLICENINLSKAQLQAYKDSNEIMLKFIESHCNKTYDKLECIEKNVLDVKLITHKNKVD